MNLQQFERSLECFEEGNINTFSLRTEDMRKFFNVAEAANKYMKTIQERRPEFVSFERLLETLETLEEE